MVSEVQVFYIRQHFPMVLKKVSRKGYTLIYMDMIREIPYCANYFIECIGFNYEREGGANIPVFYSVYWLFDYTDIEDLKEKKIRNQSTI